MPRRGGRSASPRPRAASSGSPFSSSARRQSPPPPAQRPAAPPPAQPSSGGGMMSGLGATMMQGMALGTGSAMAHRAVDAVLGSRHPAPAEAQQAAQTIVQDHMPCSDQAKAFSDCMGLSNGDMEACRVFFERMQECRLALQ